MRQFYKYRLQVRVNEAAILHYAGRLFQQYIVDMAAKVEQNELNYLAQINSEFVRSCTRVFVTWLRMMLAPVEPMPVAA